MPGWLPRFATPRCRGHELVRPSLLALDVFHKLGQVIVAPNVILFFCQMVKTQYAQQAQASRHIGPQSFAVAQ